MTPAKDLRQFAAAGVFVILLIALLLFLTYIPVPDSNKDIIVTIIGVLMGGAASAMPKLFGDDNAAAAEAKIAADRKVAIMAKKLDTVETKYEMLKTNHDYLVAMLVEHHVISGAGLIGKASKATKE